MKIAAVLPLEETMRAVVLAAVLGLAIAPLAVRSASACDRMAGGHEHNIVLAANGCGAGMHWVAAHRDAAGHLIPGHCTPS